MEKPIDWLLAASPWVQYQTRTRLLSQNENNELVSQARKAMLDHPLVQAMVAEVANWPGAPLVSHKSAGHLIHKLSFLADLGLKTEDPGMEVIINKVMSHQEAEGPFQVMTNYSTKYGGSGENIWAWMLCDAPTLLYSLTRFGLAEEARVKKGIEYLTSLIRENGWPCVGSTRHGAFRGPGRKIDPCPYANLIMLKLIAEIPAMKNSEAAQMGCETLLHCWSERLTFHPYIFYMGNDFCKLKAPLVWYDILHVAFVLAKFDWVKNDPRFLEMKGILAQKADAEGKFSIESVWQAWKDWDFGQKKQPSAWLTCLVYQVLDS